MATTITATARTLAVLLVLAALPTAGAAPSDQPILRIETGMHTAPINRIDVDDAGRLLVTGSDDKTVRVWDLESGELLRVLRPPIGEGNEGKIYAVALSPDGAIVAAGGWTRVHDQAGLSVYLFDSRSGRLLRRITGLPNVVHHLAFSRDGSRLAAALGGGNGIRVFRAAGGDELKRDTAYDGGSYGADFAADGRLVTSSEDGKLRLYGRDLELLAAVRAPGGEPLGIAFSPNGRRIAVGYHDTTRVDVVSGDDLTLLYRANHEGTNKDLYSVAWSADGTVLFAAGRYTKNSMSRIRRWTAAGRGPYRDLDGPRGTVMTLRALGDGRLVFGSGDPAWGVLDAGGEIVRRQRPQIANPRGLLDGFRVDGDGSTVRLAFEQWGKRPALYSLADRRLILDPAEDPGLKPPRTAAPGLEITGWEDTRDPKLNGKPLALKTYERSRSLAIAADGRSFLLGTEWSLRSFTRDGKQNWRQPVPGVAWSVNLTADGRLAVAALGDGTIRWYRARDGEELLALYPHADGRRWVLWTPSGYYDASAGGEELLGWHVNNGPDRAADFHPASRFRGRFHRPDVVDLVLATADEDQAVRRADAARPRPVTTEPVLALLPPRVTILSPADGAEVRETPIEVVVEVRSPSGHELTGLRAFVDGRRVEGGRGIGFDPTPAPPAKTRRHTLRVSIPPRDCTVAVLAETAVSTSEYAVVKLRWASRPVKARPKVFVLAVGVSEYADPRRNLGFAARDARDVAAVWQRQRGPLYEEVTVRTLTDAGATKDDILDGLEWLELETGRDDVAVLFFAGHGINDPRSGDFCFLGHDADLAARRRTLVMGSEIRSVLSSVRGKMVLFLDSCHAGRIFEDLTVRNERDASRFINELTDAGTGVVVFSASTGAQQSQESAKWGNGAFSKALTEALSGKGDLDRDGAIMINELGQYLDRRVRELTHGLQTPTMATPESIPNFPLAMVLRGGG